MLLDSLEALLSLHSWLQFRPLRPFSVPMVVFFVLLDGALHQNHYLRLVLLLEPLVAVAVWPVKQVEGPYVKETMTTMSAHYSKGFVRHEGVIKDVVAAVKYMGTAM